MHSILVVDDDPLAGEMTSAILESEGYQVHLVDNGIEALDTFEQHPEIALIISDMNMPLMTGIELFETLHNQHIIVPFILLTGDDPHPLQQQAPNITGCLLKDDALEAILPLRVHQILGDQETPLHDR